MNFKDCKNITAIGSVTGNSVYISDDDALKIQRIKDKTNTDIDKWTEGLMETEAVQVVVKKLTSGKRVVTITGHPGEGKTTLGYMVLKEMRKRGYPVFVVVNQADFFHLYVKEPKAIFMLDDILGTFTFDREAYKKWESVIRELVKMEEHQGSYRGMFDSKYEVHNCALLIGRDNTFQEAKNYIGRYKEHIFGKNSVVDISHDVVLTDVDKINILRHHCDKAGLQVSDEDCKTVMTVSSPHGFPHCCRIYASIKKGEGDLPSRGREVNLHSFFSSPLEFLDQTTTVFLTDETIRNMFMLLLKSDGRVDTDCEDNDAERQKLKSVENQLVDCYLKRDDDMVTFSHPSIYESVAFGVGAKDPVLVIKYCSLEFIMQRVRIGKKKTTSDPRGFLCICTSRGNKLQLIKRFVMEIRQKNFFVLHHEVFSDDDMCKQILYAALTPDDGKTAGMSLHEYPAIDVNDRDDRNKTLLLIASRTHNVVAIETLMKHGADVNLTRCSETVLHDMCRNGFIDGVKLIIKNVNDVIQTDSWGRNALFFICESNNFNRELINIFLQAGFTVDNAVVLGPCIDMLCQKGEKEALRSLVNCVSDEDNKTKFERFVSHLLTCMDVNVKELFSTPFKDPDYYREEQMSRINFLCGKGMEDTVRQMIGDIKLENELDVIGMAAIHYASCSHTVGPSLINLLIAHGADVNLPDCDGMTALHHLCFAGSVECVRTIIGEVRNTDHGCARHQITPLQCAAMTASNCEHVQIIQLLLGHSADPTVLNTIGLSAFHYMCVRGIREGVELMLTYIDKNDLDKNQALDRHINDVFTKGETALHLACSTSAANLDVVKLLVQFGADVNAPDARGNTPLHNICMDSKAISWCIRRRTIEPIHDVPEKREQIRYDIGKYMIEMGANGDVQNEDGVEALNGKFRRQLEHEQMQNT